MENLTTNVSNLMRSIASSLQVPVIIILLVLLACAVALAGSLIAEYFTERRHLKANMPTLFSQLHISQNLVETIEGSALLKRQKTALIEITKHPEVPADSLNALAIHLIEDEEERYSKKLKRTELIAKVAPMFGLMGTLIPLGPGIIALGRGDTYTLSLSLLTAFDTTIIGLIAAAIALVVSTVQKRWYNKYLSVLKALMECVLEAVEKQTEGQVMA